MASHTDPLPPDAGGGWTPAPRRRWGRAAAAAVAGLAVLAVVATPAGRAAASNFLGAFRSERIAVVGVPADAGTALAALGDLGTVTGAPPFASTAPAGSLAEAQEVVGFPVRGVPADVLPAGLPRDPEITVAPAGQMRFTFDRARADAFYRRAGHPDLRLPERFDGATLVIGVPAAVLLTYGAADGERMLVVGQSDPLTADVEPPAAHPDVSLSDLRAFLLSLPGIPAELAAQLAAIDDWRRTLPLPVPVEHVRWEDATVGGRPAVALSALDGLARGILWQDGARILGVGGTLTGAETAAVAEAVQAQAP